MNIGFERIDPTPSYVLGITAASFAGLPWTSKAAIVTAFKTSLKLELRSTQRGLCCYCRRPLPSDPPATHLEHFIEKEAWSHFAFEIRNLALSCSTCNGKKNKAYALLCGRLTRRASKNVPNPAKVVRCPVLVSNVAPVAITSSADFRWVHPHLDTFSEHITVRKGYVFQKRTMKGHRTIKGLELNSVGRLEHRAAIEKLSLTTGPISLTIGLAAQLQFNSPSQVYMMAAEVIRGKLKGAQGR